MIEGGLCTHVDNAFVKCGTSWPNIGKSVVIFSLPAPTRLLLIVIRFVDIAGACLQCCSTALEQIAEQASFSNTGQLGTSHTLFDNTRLCTFAVDVYLLEDLETVSFPFL